uniref:Small ribosomal subunit protein bS6m n=1 Tax=Timema californicum TaxID=61474 RepID=A0A7R9JBF8_TIMCA|nr:unnamed protein product [Timema californicum]
MNETIPDLSLVRFSLTRLNSLVTANEPEVVSTLKRTSEAIFETGGFIRKLENLGTREIPYKTSAHGQVHKKASYFLLKFDCPPKHLYDLSEGYGRDVDIVRHRVYKVKEPEQFECTIEEETKPPAYRQVIIKKKKSCFLPFIYLFDCPPKHLYDLSEGYGRDVDIVRHRVYKVKEPEQFECTIEEETKPPAYRQVIISTLSIPGL